MVYNFNLGIGWASSGVEYAQAYRAKLLRGIGQEAKFIFTDMFPQENIQHMTENIGFLDSEVIWLYTFYGLKDIPCDVYAAAAGKDVRQQEFFRFRRRHQSKVYFSGF